MCTTFTTKKGKTLITEIKGDLNVKSPQIDL